MKVASKVLKCRSISILSINGGTKELIHHVEEGLEGACVTGFGLDRIVEESR
jgi:hypothetical protein